MGHGSWVMGGRRAQAFPTGRSGRAPPLPCSRVTPLPHRQDNKGNHEWNEIHEWRMVGRTVPVSRLGRRISRTDRGSAGTPRPTPELAENRSRPIRSIRGSLNEGRANRPGEPIGFTDP